MPVTTSSIMPESGSRRKPHGTSKPPTVPLPICSGIDGIHCATVTSNARASGASPRSCQNATSDRTSAASIVVHATAPAALRENERIPMRPLMAAPTPGNSGMSQMYFIFLQWRRGPTPAPPAHLPSHHVHFVDVDRFLVAVEGENDPEPHRGLRRRHGNDEHREDLADRILKLVRVRHEV